MAGEYARTQPMPCPCGCGTDIVAVVMDAGVRLPDAGCGVEFWALPEKALHYLGGECEIAVQLAARTLVMIDFIRRTNEVHVLRAPVAAFTSLWLSRRH